MQITLYFIDPDHYVEHLREVRAYIDALDWMFPSYEHTPNSITVMSTNAQDITFLVQEYTWITVGSRIG